jgi:hypothetical protein
LEDLIQLKYQTTGTSLNILGISTTNMNDNLARFSTSEDALEKPWRMHLKNMTQKQKYLSYGNCFGIVGYYSQHMNACTWPCSITNVDGKDGMTQVYRDGIVG